MKKDTRNTVPIDADALQSDVRHILEVVAEGAQALEIAGRSLFDAIAETSRLHPADELWDRAVRLRAGAKQVTEISNTVQAAAGRLEGISLARRIIESELDANHAAPKRPRRR
jgi:hypothetical protein